jgi:hypothetical protein
MTYTFHSPPPIFCIFCARAGGQRAFPKTRRSGRGLDDHDQLELRYFYRNPHGEEEGIVSLPGDATSADVEGALTGIYRRVHERPVRRTLGGGQRNRPGATTPGHDAGQLGLEFSPDTDQN